MWAGGGNVNPFLCLAEELAARGHRVGAVGGPGLRERLETVGVDLVVESEGWLPGPADLLAAADSFGPDALVVDYMLTGALCGAERTGVPTAALVHTLYRALLVDNAPHPMGMAATVEALSGVRSGLGLGPISGYADLLAARELVMVTAPRELDEPGDLPANVAYVGGLFQGPGPDGDWRPPPGPDPLVAVSLGTAGDAAIESQLLDRLFEAFSGHALRVVVTLPDYIGAASHRPPSNVVLSGYVRHSALIPHAAVLVTHAGLGSVVAALAYGVPMVCLPLGREQPENAAAVTRIGAGCTVAPDAGADEIRAAVKDQLARSDRVLIEPDPAGAADRVETILGSL